MVHGIIVHNWGIPDKADVLCVKAEEERMLIEKLSEELNKLDFENCRPGILVGIVNPLILDGAYTKEEALCLFDVYENDRLRSIPTKKSEIEALVRERSYYEDELASLENKKCSLEGSLNILYASGKQDNSLIEALRDKAKLDINTIENKINFTNALIKEFEDMDIICNNIMDGIAEEEVSCNKEEVTEPFEVKRVPV